MSRVFRVLLVFAVSGMIFSGYSAAAPVAGVDYDIGDRSWNACSPESGPGDRLMQFLFGHSEPAEYSPDQGGDRTIGVLLQLACG